MKEINDEKELAIWIDTSSKIISMKKIPNSKKKVFRTEEERIEFGAILVFKGYKMG